MNRIFDAVKILVLCGVILISGKASAEGTEIDPGIEAMKLFRETLVQTADRDNRPFHQDVYFVMPRVTGVLEFFAGMEKGNLKMAGNFDFWSMDNEGQSTDMEAPFYLVQDKQNVTLYFESDKKWKKMTSPISAAELVDVLITSDAEDIETKVACVKEVRILQDGDKSRTLLVKLDGEKLFNEIKTEMAKDPDFQKQAENELSKAIDNIFENGFRNADIWYTWTVDKTNWQTDTMSFNLSNLVQSIALAALADRSQEFTSMEPIREMLEAVAYYSELKAYTAFLNPSAVSNLEIPKKVLKAKEVDSFTDDKKSKK